MVRTGAFSGGNNLKQGRDLEGGHGKRPRLKTTSKGTSSSGRRENPRSKEINHREKEAREDRSRSSQGRQGLESGKRGEGDKVEPISGSEKTNKMNTLSGERKHGTFYAGRENTIGLFSIKLSATKKSKARKNGEGARGHSRERPGERKLINETYN